MASGFYSFALIVALIYAILVMVIDLRRHGLRTVVERPQVIFSLYFAIVHFFTPLIKFNTGTYRFSTFYSEEMLFQAFLHDFAAFNLALFIFSIFGRDGARPLYIRTKDALIFRRAGMAIFALGALFAARDYLIISSFGLQNFLSDRIYSGQIRGEARTLAFLMMPGMVLYSCSYFMGVSRHWVVKITIGIMLGVICAYYFVVSQRNSIMIAGLLLFVASLTFGSDRLRKFAPSQRVLSIVFGVLVMVAVGYQMTVARYSTNESAYAQQRRERALYYGLDGAFGNDEINVVLQQIPYDPLWGRTYVAGLTVFVPRVMWPDKPLGAGPEITNWIAPGSYVLGRSGISSLTTGLMVEARMNFGRWGWLGIIVIWGVIVGWLFRAARRNFDPLSRLILTVAGVSLVSLFIYYEFLGFVVHFGLLLVPLMLIWLFRPRTRLAAA